MSIHSTVSGSGPRVVCTHGLGATSATWHAQVQGLDSDHEVVTWDLPGHGASGVVPGRRYDRDTAIEYLSQVSGPAVSVHVGHSLGGYLALVHAVRHPGRVAGLVLIATGPGFRDPVSRRRWNAWLRRFARERGIPSAVMGIATQPDALVIDRLDAIEVPVAVVVGGADWRFHAGAAQLVRRLDATLVVVEGAGHAVHETHPVPVNRAILDLCARVRAAAGTEGD